MDEREWIESWPRIGGHLALDFVNTVGGLPSSAHLDVIATYDLLLGWSEAAGAISPGDARQLAAAARLAPAAADEATERAHVLRDSLYVLIDGLRTGSDAAARDWARVRPVLVDAMAHAAPAVTNGRVSWTWDPSAGPATPLFPVVVAAVELVTGADLALVRRCGRCRFLFLDRSRNHARRWCDMRTCGFADKVERQSERRRASRDSAGPTS